MDVHVKDQNVLYKIKELVEKQSDEVSTALERIDQVESIHGSIEGAQREVKHTLEQHQGLLENVNKRLDQLDATLPKGGKFYTAAHGEDSKTAVRRSVGEMIVDFAREARKMPEKYGWLTNMRTQQEGNPSSPGTDAGLLVPYEQASEIIRLVANFGFARRNCRIMPMTREVMRLPVSTYGPTSLVGNSITPSGSAAYYNESRTPGQSAAAFTRPELVAARLMAIDTISIEVDADSDPSLMAFLVDVFAEAVALAEDYQALRGDSDPFKGVLNETGTGTHTMASGSTSFKNIAYSDLVDIYGAADEKAQDSGIWVCSAYAFNQIRKALKDNDGYPLMNVSQPITGAIPMQIFGRPVITSSVMPKGASADTSATKFICYGDFGRYAIFGDRARLSIDVSPHAAFTSGDLVMRVLERFAFVVAVPSAFGIGKTGS